MEADLSGLWLDLRYLLCMDSFDPSKLSENALKSFEAFKFIPFMQLKSPCHFEAFNYFFANCQLNAQGIEHQRFDNER